MGRRPRFDFSGFYHHIMLRGNQGDFIFKDNNDFKFYLNLLGRGRDEKGFKLIAYCLMGNHIHLLMKTGEVHLSKIMHWISVNYTKYFNKKYELSGHVFQGRYKNILIEKDRYLLEVSRYIHLNPVMAGVTSRPEDYTWSSYPDYIGTGNKNFVNKEEILDEFSIDNVVADLGRHQIKQSKLCNYSSDNRGRYCKFVEEKITDMNNNKYPEELVKQVILGSKEFTESMLKSLDEYNTRIRKVSKIPANNKEDVIKYIGEKFGVTMDELKNGGKSRRISEIRQIVVYLLRERAHLESVEIKKLLNLDISTISRNCQKIYEGIKNGNRKALEAVEHFS